MTLNSKALGIDAIRATLLRASVEFSAHKMYQKYGTMKGSQRERTQEG